MSHPDGGPEETASLVQGSGRSYFSSIFIWQISCYCRGLGYMWAALFASSSWRVAGIVSSVQALGSLRGSGRVRYGEEESWNKYSVGPSRGKTFL